MAAVPHPARTERIELSPNLGNQRAKVFKVAYPCRPESRFQSARGVLDGIEVRTVEWEEQNSSAKPLNGFTDPHHAMDTQPIENHDISWYEHWAEMLKDLFENPVTVQSPFERHLSSDTIHGHSAYDADALAMRIVDDDGRLADL
jgi:hypothetical protein